MQQLDRPARDPRTTRHNSRTVVRARELHEAGWTPTEIRRRLFTELGVTPAISTICMWVEPELVEWHKAYKARSRQRKERGVTDADLLSLREEDGLTYTAISKVVRRFYGVEMGPETIRFHLHKLGVEKNPNKVRVNEARCAA